MKKDRFQLGTEEKIAIPLGNVERLDSHAVARQNQCARGLGPDRQRKHSAQARKTIRVPFDEGVECDFGVTIRAELVAALFQLGAQLLVVVNFTIEDDRCVSVGGRQRLVSGVQIDNLQTHGAQRNRGRPEHAHSIRSAMPKRGGGLTDTFWIRTSVSVGEAGNSAQRRPLFRASSERLRRSVQTYIRNLKSLRL